MIVLKRILLIEKRWTENSASRKSSTDVVDSFVVLKKGLIPILEQKKC